MSGLTDAGAVSRFDVRPVAYDSGDAQALVEQVQGEYVTRYGGRDQTPVAVAEFTAPHGGFWVGYLHGRPVATGGWRLLPPGWVSDCPGLQAEVKRMYVSPPARGRGLARALLGHLERTAQAAGVDWLVLETGPAQPEALTLYGSAGYVAVAAFGHYACTPGSIHLGKRLAGEP